MPDLDWLIARPVAHRGLHDAQKNIIENTPSAFSAAIAGRYGIECDLQITADGEAMVHHDEALGRLTEGDARLDTMTAADLKRVAYKTTADRMITLGELCDLVAGRVTLVIELKSRFDGDVRLVARAAEVLSGYAGPAAVMSFDPAQIADLRRLAPGRTRGMVAESRYRHGEWSGLPAATRRAMTYFQHTRRTSPQFIAYSVRDLPATIPTVARRLFGLPILTWTVRSADDRRKAERYADQMIFEGFRP
jgi:glycerophosphoryl diester phosphodiesterase